MVADGGVQADHDLPGAGVDVRAIVARLPAAPGVYRFRDGRGRVLYLGRAVELRRRVASYWGDLGQRWHLTRMVRQIARVEAAVCDSAHEAAWLERNLLEQTLPRYNRTAGGQEVPVHVRLHRRLGSAQLDVVHVDGRPAGGLFGPYLGGARVRAAVSALHRVLPLGYAGDRLGGSERDMARVLGVSPGDLHGLVVAVTAVLNRDPVAVESVRAEIARRRDAAAAALAFELAARLQAETEALDWVISAQRVTLPEPADFDVHGWAGGVLVEFEMRAGRLAGWRQRRCGEPAARALLAATPPEWRDFAQRNAELAARLMG